MQEVCFTLFWFLYRMDIHMFLTRPRSMLLNVTLLLYQVKDTNDVLGVSDVGFLKCAAHRRCCQDTFNVVDRCVYATDNVRRPRPNLADGYVKA